MITPAAATLSFVHRVAILSIRVRAWLRSNERARRTRLVAQMERTDCAAACLAILLGAHGHAAPLSAVRARCGVGREGASAAAIVLAASEFGLRVQAYRVTPQSLVELALPAIVHVDGDHFVVLRRRTATGWSVLDPAAGAVWWSDADLARRLCHIALVGTPGDGFVARRATQPGLARYLAQLRRCRSAIGLVVVSTLLLEVAALVPPTATRLVVDHVIQPGNGDLLAAITVAAAAAGAGHLLLLFVRDRVIQALHAVLDISLLGEFVGHALRLPMSDLAQRPVGDMMQRVQANVALREFSSGSVRCLCDIAMALAYAGLMLSYHPLLCAGVVSMHLARLGLTRVESSARRDAAAREQAAAGLEQNAASEALGALEFVQGFGLQEAVSRRQRDRRNERGRAALERIALVQRNARRLLFFDSCTQAVLLGATGTAVIAGQLSLGQFAAFLVMAAALGRPLQSMMNLAGELTMLRGSLERVDDILGLAQEVSGTRRPGSTAGAIDLRDVHHRFSRHAPWTLDGITLRVDAGECVAIVGPSGAGKSTLAGLLVGLWRPTSGTVLLDDEDLAELDVRTVRQRVAIVLQDSFVFDDTLRANLMLGDLPVSDRDLAEATRAAQLHEVAQALPRGLDTPLGTGGSRLSAGQRQRIALCRALARHPKVLVLDEATGHLDAVTEAAIHAELEKLACTRIIISHRLSTMQHVDRILVMSAGRIVQQGRYAALAAEPGTFRDLLQAGEFLC